MRQLAHMQLLFHPTQLTELVLRGVPLGDQGLDIIAANLTQLRRLALLDCGIRSGLTTLVAPPNLPSLDQLVVTDPTWRQKHVWESMTQLLQQVRLSLDVHIAQKPTQLPAGAVEHSPVTAFDA
jgi:hypothetical protein